MDSHRDPSPVFYIEIKKGDTVADLSSASPNQGEGMSKGYKEPC